MLSSTPFVVEGSGAPATTLYQKFGNTEAGICTAGCTRSDTLLATGTVGNHFYKLSVGLSVFPWEFLAAADGTAWIDLDVYVDPNATFGPGMFYADYYGVVLPENVTPAIPEPSTAALLAAGLLGRGASTHRRRGARC
jgi:hypothetical protein